MMAVRKWQLKEKAINLRKKGLSYKEIKQFVPVSKSTLSLWLRDVFLTEKQLEILRLRYDLQLRGSKAVRAKRQAEIKIIKEEAKKQIKSVNNKEFMIAGLMLYWAEGNKTHSVGVTNSDYRIIQFMMIWFREFCKVPENKFRAHLHLHSGQDENKIKKYWSNLTKIPLAQFGKSHIKKEGTGHRKRILYNGTIKINICDKNLLYRIEGLIEKVSIITMGC